MKARDIAQQLIYKIILIYFVLGGIGFYLINRKKDRDVARKSYTKFGVYFIIINIFYICDKKRYESVKRHLLIYINNLYELKKDTLLDDSELVHLTLDLITCPYIDISFKKSLLAKYGIEKSYVKRIAALNQFWFTKWHKFDFTKELDAKLSNSVY